MSASKRRVPLPGSERTALPSARAAGAADPKERIEVTVVLRPRTTGEGVAAALSAQPPQTRQYLNRAELAVARGAAPEDVAQVVDFARAHGLDVVEANSARRSVVLAGTVAALNAAFGVELQYDHPGGAYRGRTGAIHVPEALVPIVQAVLGLDDRPQADRTFASCRPRRTLRNRARTAPLHHSTWPRCTPFLRGWTARARPLASSSLVAATASPS
jgi:kumamolisin